MLIFMSHQLATSVVLVPPGSTSASNTMTFAFETPLENCSGLGFNTHLGWLFFLEHFSPSDRDCARAVTGFVHVFRRTTPGLENLPLRFNSSAASSARLSRILEASLFCNSLCVDFHVCCKGFAPPGHDLAHPAGESLPVSQGTRFNAVSRRGKK